MPRSRITASKRVRQTSQDLDNQRIYGAIPEFATHTAHSAKLSRVAPSSGGFWGRRLDSFL